MKVIMISTDKNIFKKSSAIRKRTIEYGELFEEMHVIIFSKKSPTLEPERISEKVWIYPTNSSFKFSYISNAAKLCGKIAKEFSPNSKIIISSQDPFETGLAAYRASKKINAKLHVQVNADFLSYHFRRESFANRIRVVIAKYVLSKADGIRVVSVRIKNSLMASDTNLKALPVILPMFVDVRYIADRKPAFDVHHEYPEFKFVIIMASRLAREKNIPLALKVLKEIVDKHPSVGMVIVGDGPERERLKRMAERLGVSRRVAFDLWQDDVFSYFRTADLFLQTSFHEGYGMSMVEAAASGCPIVTSDVGAVRNIFTNSESALFCQSSDKGCFAWKISSLIEDENLRKVLGLRAKDAVLSNLESDKNKYLEEYRKMAGLNEEKVYGIETPQNVKQL